MQSRRSKAVRIRPKAAETAGAARRHPMAVFTAVDGTLLDSMTFDAGANRALIERLSDAGVPVIPVSVMTMSEIEPLAAELGFRHAMIIEAGGAIARRAGSAWEIEPCGPPAETFLDVIRGIEERSGANLLVYSALGESDASILSGRSGEMLTHSLERRFSEPFTIESGSLDDVRKAASDLGFNVRQGRRFLYLCRECDSGEAFTRVREELGCDVAVALGGSALDADFLTRADIPIIVPGADGVPDQELLATVAHARIASAPAPEGWAAAVETAWMGVDALKSKERPA